MELKQHEQDGIQVIKILNDKIVHANAADFKTAMIEYIQQGMNRLLLDMSNVQFIDSRGLGVLISIHKSIGPGGMLGVCAVNDKVCKVFELTRLDKIFNMYTDHDSAISAMQSPS